MIGIWGAIVSSIVAYFCWLMIYLIGGQKSLYISYKWSELIKNFSIFLLYELILITIFLIKKDLWMPVLITGSVAVIIALVIINYKVLLSFAAESKAIVKSYASNAITALKK